MAWPNGYGAPDDDDLDQMFRIKATNITHQSRSFCYQATVNHFKI